MPRINIYNIVTNDALELPVKCDVVGTAAVAEYLGMNKMTVSACICKNAWSHNRKFKAVIVGETSNKLSEFERKLRRAEESRRAYLRRKERQKCLESC